jgi:quercetin dioxygenase-like cupin family protein
MNDLRTGVFDTPDETRKFDKGRAELVTLGDSTIGRFTFEPGWRWSECVKPIAGTESCQSDHVGYAQSGTIRVVSDAGKEVEITAGQAYTIPPGHDAWVVGDESFVGFEFKSAAEYAKPK